MAHRTIYIIANGGQNIPCVFTNSLLQKLALLLTVQTIRLMCTILNMPLAHDWVLVPFYGQSFYWYRVEFVPLRIICEDASKFPLKFNQNSFETVHYWYFIH